LLSGTVSRQILEFNERNAIGLAVLKTVTLKPKEPNREPRMWDLGFGVLNSIGLFNPGVERFLETELQEYLETGYDLGISLSEFSQPDFIRLVEVVSTAVNEYGQIKVLELNFSCPNVKSGGIQFAAQPEAIKEITSAASSFFQREVWVKVSPAFDVITQAQAAYEGGATAVVVANTLPAAALKEDLTFSLGSISGGLSGPALYPVNLLNVYRLKDFPLPLIGSGGVDSYFAFKGYLKAGAVAAGIGTALFKDPELPTKIAQMLERELKAASVHTLDEFLKALRSDTRNDE